MKIEYLGNKELFGLPKTAFLAPRQIAPGAIMPSYDWANKMVEQGRCIISGFTSPIERDVWDFLIKGNQPIIFVSFRSKFVKIPMQYRPLLDSNRLLIIFLNLTKQISKDIALKRNKYLAEIADEIVFPYIHQSSSLYNIFKLFNYKSTILYD